MLSTSLSKRARPFRPKIWNGTGKTPEVGDWSLWSEVCSVTESSASSCATKLIHHPPDLIEHSKTCDGDETPTAALDGTPWEKETSSLAPQDVPLRSACVANSSRGHAVVEWLGDTCSTAKQRADVIDWLVERSHQESVGTRAPLTPRCAISPCGASTGGGGGAGGGGETDKGVGTRREGSWLTWRAALTKLALPKSIMRIGRGRPETNKLSAAKQHARPS